MKNRLIPIKWKFSNNIFNNSHRGLLVYLYKLMIGEKFLDIRGQHLSPGRRSEFCHMSKGKDSNFVTYLSSFDRTIAPLIDSIANSLCMGHIMIVQAQKY